MSENGIKFVGDGHLKFKSLLKNFSKEMEKQIGVATKQSALFLRKEIRTRIREKKYDENAPLTIALKGQDFALVDDSEMLQAMEINIISPFKAEVGFLKIKQTSHGGDLKKVLEVLHEGKVIEVTPKMRAFFAAKGLRLKESTKFLTIKGRRFMGEPFEDKDVQKSIIARWENAVGGSIKKFE